MMKVNSFSAFNFNQINNRYSGDMRYVTLPFFYDGKPASETFRDADIPMCVMSLASAGSLRYNSGRENPARQKFLDEVLPPGIVSVPVYLVHSKTVFVAEPDASFSGSECLDASGDGDNTGDCNKTGDCGIRLFEPESRSAFRPGAEGDGIITSCRSFAPCVTAADCMPVFLWDSRTGAFGICHSGWKGTGIAAKAVSLICARFGANPADICVILGPHIHECCYTVDAERAAYFRREFSPDCVSSCENDAPCPPVDGVLSGKYRLSLARANIVSLVNVGIKPENILHCTDCTSCFSLPADTVVARDATAASVAGDSTISSVSTSGADNTAGGSTSPDASGTPATAGLRDAGARFFPYGSFRRQTAHLPEGTPLEERFKVFSAMAAVIGYGIAGAYNDLHNR